MTTRTCAQENAGKYLTFKLGRERYGLSIDAVVEITGWREPTRLPGQPGDLRGVVNLRGEIIPVVDMGLRFKGEPIEADDRTCIVVLKVLNRTVGLMVERVLEVADLPAGVVSEPPEMGSSRRNPYLKAVARQGETIVVLLDAERLLTASELDCLSGLDHEEEDAS